MAEDVIVARLRNLQTAQELDWPKVTGRASALAEWEAHIGQKLEPCDGSEADYVVEIYERKEPRGAGLAGDLRERIFVRRA